MTRPPPSSSQPADHRKVFGHPTQTTDRATTIQYCDIDSQLKYINFGVNNWCTRYHCASYELLEIFSMAAIYGICLLLAAVFASCLAVEPTDIQVSRGIGLEEIVLFLIGLGVASALGLALMIGPMFAIFYSSIHGLPYGGNNGNSINTTAGGAARALEKLTEGLKLLDEALKKYQQPS